MGFGITINDETIHGINGKIITGIYTSDSGSTGGTINLPVVEIISIFLQPKDSSISANQPVVNTTLPSPIPSVDIITSADEVGYFTAICK